MSAIEETISHRDIENWLCVTDAWNQIPEFTAVKNIPSNELVATDLRVMAAAEICGRCTLGDFCRSEASEWLAGNRTEVSISTPSVMGGLLLTNVNGEIAAEKIPDIAEIRTKFKPEVDETEAILTVHQKELQAAASHKDIRLLSALGTVWRERLPSLGVDAESKITKKSFDVLFGGTGITTNSLLVFTNHLSSWFHSDLFTHFERHLPSGADKKLEKQYQFDKFGMDKLLSRHDDWVKVQQAGRMTDEDILQIAPAIEGVEQFFVAKRTTIPEIGSYPIPVAIVLLQRLSNEKDSLDGQREARKELLIGELARYLKFWGLDVGHKGRRIYVKQSPQLKEAQDAIKSRIKGGKCAGLPPELFVPSEESPLAEEKAKKVCKSCPIREECLSVALADKNNTGIWGGTNDAERRKLRRQARAQARFTGA